MSALVFSISLLALAAGAAVAGKRTLAGRGRATWGCVAAGMALGAVLPAGALNAVLAGEPGIWDAPAVGFIAMVVSVLLAAGVVGFGRKSPVGEGEAQVLTREQAQSYLRMALDSMPGGFMLTDKDLKIQLFNNEFLKFSGLSKDIVKPGMSHEQLIRTMAERGYLGEDVDVEAAVAERIASLKDPTDKSFLYTTPDGRTHEVRRRKTETGDLISISLDVTERVEQEKLVRESEENLQSLLDTSPVGIGVVDQETDERLFVNKRLVELLGADSADELTSHNLADSYVNEADVAAIRRVVADGGSVQEMEVQRRRLDGTTFWALQSSQELGQFRGRPARVVWMVDVSELKDVQGELANQKAIIDTALENMGQGISMFDDDLNLLAFNDRFISLLDFPEELARPGTPLAAFFRYNAKRGEYGDGDIDQLVRERVELAMKFEPHQFQRELSDGTIIEVTGQPVATGGFVTTYTDITETVEAQHSAKLLKEALDTFHDMVILYDKNEKVIFTNDRYHEIYPNSPPKDEITNYTMEGLLRRSLEAGQINQPLAKTDPEAWLKQALELRRNKEGGSGETSHANGQTYFYRYGWTTEGGMILVQFDITDRKHMEEALKAGEQQLRVALENMPGAMWLVDKDMKLVFANDQYVAIYGDPDGLVKPGADITEILKAEIARGSLSGEGTPEEILDERIRSYRTDKTITFEDRTPDGGYVQLTRKPAPSGDNVSIAVDITDRKRAEQIIADAMRMIAESIQYASRIQRSVLPTPDQMAEEFADHMVIWEPKDVVGGDIYLLRKCATGTLLFVADCTGHGVPGAFMTMIATGALDQAIIENPNGDPSSLLQRVNQLVKTTLGQYEDMGGESDDGFECGLCLIEPDIGKMTYAGARFELWQVLDGELEIIKGDRAGIGYRKTPIEQPFTNHWVLDEPGAMYYLFSDGMTDQIGGKKRRSFGKRRLKGHILDYYPMSMEHQSARLKREFDEYQHNEERRDDITLIGFVPNRDE